MNRTQLVNEAAQEKVPRLPDVGRRTASAPRRSSARTLAAVPERAQDPKLISLNLVYDYPVHWSRFKVLRDMIQNFYDAVPRHEWERRFLYKIENKTLFLSAVDVGFSYDWLIPIGASTKRGGDKNYAGYFGEGFKIASLCAVRDHGWDVEICSRDWKLTVVTTELKVGGCDLTSLGYKIWSNAARESDTIMRISPFADEALLTNVLWSFYYSGNPLFGEKVWESPEAAVYLRSKEPKPTGYPRTHNDPGPGIVFAGYQALGSCQPPLVFCLHNFRRRDRERNSFYRMDVRNVVQRIASMLPADASARVLRRVKNRWYDRPRKKYDFESWHHFIAILVRNVAASPRHKSTWKADFPHLLAARQVKRSNIPEYNRRRQALDWVRDSGRRYRLVNECFLALGYPTLEQACEEDGGFTTTRAPRGEEVRRIQVLEQLVSLLLPELLDQIGLPPCKIITSERATGQGMAICIPIKGRAANWRGIPIRYRLPYIALKESLLHADSFGNALSTYLHELAHIFGGDRSASFSRALSEVMTITLTKSRLITTWEGQWISC